MEKKKNELLTDETVIVDSPENYKILSVTEQGRKYRTTFTKKFENRVNWVRPNPEEIKSYIPGTVDKITVKKGDYVKKNDELMIYVAMKMRNVIRAPFNGIVERIVVKEGDHLPKGSVMMVVKMTNESPKEIKRKVRKKAKRVKS
jgi:biotin carboxyl carrier protein